MKEESAQYLERARQSLKAAELLAEEELWPDAISRAYYCMFYAAQAALHEREVYPKTHKGLLLKFNENYIFTGEFPKQTGKMLTDVFEKRNLLDYTVGFEIDKQEGERIIGVAKTFLVQIRGRIK